MLRGFVAGRKSELVLEFAMCIFALTDDKFGCPGVARHNIDTGDHQPVKQYPRLIQECTRQ